MSWLKKMFASVPRKEREGIALDYKQPYWEVSSARGFSPLLLTLIDFLPEDCMLYFEGGTPRGSLADFLRENSVPEKAHVAYGTIWPRPLICHVPAKIEIMTSLAQEMQRNSEPELAIHFHVYRDQEVLLEWHDAFSQPMLLSGKFSESEVQAFCDELGLSYQQLVIPRSHP